MTPKKVTRKIISSLPARPAGGPKKEDQPQAKKADGPEAVEESTKLPRSKKGCLFCQNKSNPTYTDLNTLRRFLTDRAKIVGKERSGVCSKHQRQVAKNIKYVRHLALLPFVPKV